MPEGQMPQGAPAPEQGGITEAIVEVDKKLAALADAIGQNEQIPDEVKGQFAAARDAYRSGLQALMQMSGGGGDEPVQAGAVAPEQGGARGAVPMSMRRA